MKYVKIFMAGAAIAFSFMPVSAFAGIIINEVAYDLPGTDDPHEWVELFNNGTGDVTVETGTAGWRFYDGSNHIINAPLQGSVVIAPGGFAIFADDAQTFLSDHAGFPGTVFDTVMSLGNTGDTLRLIDESGTVLDEVTYASAWGAAGNGRTLERREDGGWSESLADGGTPGMANSVDIPPTPTPTPSTDSGPMATPSATPTPTPSATATPIPTPEPTLSPTPSPSPPAGGSGPSPMPTPTPTLTPSPEPTLSPMLPPTSAPLPRIHINEFYPNTAGSDSDEEFVEIWNEENFSANISNWKLDDAEGGSSPFVLPNGTTVAAGGYLVFYRGTTGIALNNDMDAVRLFTPNGQTYETVAYNDAPKGASSNRTSSGAYGWSATPTPGATNVITPLPGRSRSLPSPLPSLKPSSVPAGKPSPIPPQNPSQNELPVEARTATVVAGHTTPYKTDADDSDSAFTQTVSASSVYGAKIVDALPEKSSSGYTTVFAVSLLAAAIVFVLRLRRKRKSVTLAGSRTEL